MAFDKTRFGGVVAPIVTPCGEDDSLDRGALEANLTRLLATDVAGLYINGGTGDAANLTQDERLETAALLVPRLLARQTSARPWSWRGRPLRWARMRWRASPRKNRGRRS